MPALDVDIVPLIEAQEIRTNFIVEILTETPRRFTNYRGLTSDGRRGLIVGGEYYRATIIEVPGIEESDDGAPVRLALSVGNANNTNLDLYTNTANLKKAVKVTKVWFTGATWSESLAPEFRLEPWFEGKTGKPAIRGERVVVECIAEVGRRGMSPRTKSRTLMTSHQPLAPNSKITISVRS